MAQFVPVHGAFTGAWIWAPLAVRLRAAGQTVEVFDLPGLGDDATPPGDVSLNSCVACLGEVLASSAKPAIVTSNSMGGVIATQAAARYPQCVAALVYVTAFVPHDGQSLLDLTLLPEGADDQVQANIIIEPPVATMPAGASLSALYGSCSETDATWAISKQRPQPLGPFVAPVSIPAGAIHGIDRFYVLCAKDRAIPVALQRRMIAENAITNVIELDTDHTPHLSMTVALGDALQRFAHRVAAVR